MRERIDSDLSVVKNANEQELFKCEECDYSNTAKENVEAHERNVHGRQVGKPPKRSVY